MSDSIFSKIIRREIPANIVFEDETVIAFADINPQAKYHFLIVPKKQIETVNGVTPEDEQVMGHLFAVARELAIKYGVAESGYRLSVNTNRDAGQEVFHIHMHFLAGNKLGSMV
ncbi:histidine triad nucleotide-binding protein [Psittacicella hinzii]|uniref:Histidine triad nucleotide-binding protein n=1 Tax=Psittacicella hinzii TaxID=2028575 RepID=A0A3A1YIN1_9GAMM|nr:histidine triad nucleotide-binding protein [Psittacicella hinzii]RIY37119.1 histidine triad nucleotide-binding protein [Psittacicella hinzii]